MLVERMKESFTMSGLASLPSGPSRMHCKGPGGVCFLNQENIWDRVKEGQRCQAYCLAIARTSSGDTVFAYRNTKRCLLLSLKVPTTNTDHVSRLASCFALEHWTRCTKVVGRLGSLLNRSNHDLFYVERSFMTTATLL